jgi:acetamidase/formamidase
LPCGPGARIRGSGREIHSGHTLPLTAKPTIHEIPLGRAALHGHFSPELPPVLEIAPGDAVRFSVLDAGWGLEPPLLDGGDRRLFEPRHAKLDDGHALVGPIAVRGARAGQVLSVRVDELRVGPYGFTFAGGWDSPTNVRLGVEDDPGHALVWSLDARAGTAMDQRGRIVQLRPFLGVMGMPPPQPGTYPTAPPRAWGGNIDCSELVVGATLFLPIPVDGALFSAGDGHGRQGDGEVSGLAIECPLELAQLSIDVIDGLSLAMPVAHTDEAWIAFGFDESLDEAAALAIDGMLGIMRRELGLERADALALASVVADLRVTQVVNGVRGVHAMLRRDAIRFS